MLKISVAEEEKTGRIETEVEASGPIDDVVAELGLAVLRLYQGLSASNPRAGQVFRAATVSMFTDPAFWTHELKGECTRLDASVCKIPRS